MMDPMLNKPKSHRSRSPWALILMIGFTALCFILASQESQTMTEVLVQPR
ncbi:hypothetical protein [Pseudotabrizicola sediminis]|nr:hypothetical protein [Pseudotabrizicola sediminis]